MGFNSRLSLSLHRDQGGPQRGVCQLHCENRRPPRALRPNGSLEWHHWETFSPRLFVQGKECVTRGRQASFLKQKFQKAFLVIFKAFLAFFKGFFQGGPRAVGHRTNVFDSTCPKIKKKVKKHIFGGGLVGWTIFQ